MIKNRKNIYIVGYASSVGGPDPVAGDGPLVLEKSPFLLALNQRGMNLHWEKTIVPDVTNKSKLQIIKHDNQALAETITRFTQDKKFFMVLGGDHACAIGTWSGVYHAIEQQGSLGLIWIDAHMDSHTPQTTMTGNYHGMPLACLLGYGENELTHLMTPTAKIKPENLCLIGVRSFEAEEEALLKRLNVRIYYMDEVQQRGLDVIMQEALAIATNDTAGFGISLDIDSIDPMDAPATDVSESGGIRANALIQALSLITSDERLLGVEITEFDPHRDVENKTEKLIPELMMVMTGIKS